MKTPENKMIDHQKEYKRIKGMLAQYDEDEYEGLDKRNRKRTKKKGKKISDS